MDGEIQVLPGNVGVVGRHIDTGDCRRNTVDTVDRTGETSGDRVVRGIDDAGTVAVEVQAQGADTAQVGDQHRPGAAVDPGDRGDRSVGGTAEGQGEVAGIDVADVFAEGHGEADRAVVGRRRVDPGDAAGARRRGIHHHAGSAAQAIERQVQAIAGKVGERFTAQIQGIDHDTVGIGVTVLHDVPEHQLRTTAARDVGGVTGHAAHIQHQPWRKPADLDRLTGGHGERQLAAGLVATIGRNSHADHCRHHTVDLDVGRAGDVVQRGRAVVAGGIMDAAPVGVEAAAERDASAVELPARHHQTEYQGAAAGAGHIAGVYGAAGVQGHGDARCATVGVDHHALAEVDREIEVLADDVAAIGRHADAGHHRYYAIDHDIAATAQRARTSYGRQGQDRDIAGVVADHRTVHLQRGGALEVQVGADITGLYGVLEHQGVAAGAADIDRNAIDHAGFQ